MDSDGETRYYVDGVATYAGLVYWDGYFYYFNSSLKAVRSRTYWPTVTNDLIPVAEYTFDENGRITNPPVVGIDAQGHPKNVIYADADGEIRYYVDGVATYAKLVYRNGHYYYIGSSLKAVRDTTHWVSATNGLMEAGSYTFDAQGRMIDPPADALTEPISTFALTGETMSKTYAYVYASGKLMRQVLTVTIGNSTTTYAMDFFYDASGYPFAVKYNGDLCYYITNLQGDVMSIVDAQGEVVAEYEYDPYGNIVSQSGPLADVNPLRYRGYVFDSETQFYYLQSRYYDPELGRFLNADSYVSTGQGVLGNNMFAYCGNSPMNNIDPTGKADAAVIQEASSWILWLLGLLDSATFFLEATALVLVGVYVINEYVEKKEEETLAITYSAVAFGDQQAEYYLADNVGDSNGKKEWRIQIGPMDFETAFGLTLAIAFSKKYGKNANWGLYTENQEDAYKMVIALGGGNPCLHENRIGEYPHYHVYGMDLFGQYKHFHIWYGSIYEG